MGTKIHQPLFETQQIEENIIEDWIKEQQIELLDWIKEGLDKTRTWEFGDLDEKGTSQEDERDKKIYRHHGILENCSAGIWWKKMGKEGQSQLGGRGKKQWKQEESWWCLPVYRQHKH